MYPTADKIIRPVISFFFQPPWRFHRVCWIIVWCWRFSITIEFGWFGVRAGLSRTSTFEALIPALFAVVGRPSFRPGSVTSRSQTLGWVWGVSGQEQGFSKSGTARHGRHGLDWVELDKTYSHVFPLFRWKNIFSRIDFTHNFISFSGFLLWYRQVFWWNARLPSHLCQ